MLRHTSLSLARIEMLLPRLRALIYPELHPLRAEYAGPVERISHRKAQKLIYRPAATGLIMGPLWSTFWFRLSGTVPETWAGRRVDLLWVSHSEATLWRAGEPIQGLNFEPTSSTSVRRDAKLWNKAPVRELVELEVEVACNQVCGYDFRELTPYKTVSPYVFEQADLALFDSEAWDLYYDYLLLVDLLRRSDPQAATPWGGHLLAELNSVVNTLNPENRSTWPEARRILSALLAHRNGTFQQDISAMGHAHIDTAWLWPLEETERKCIRTFSTALAYAEDYPEYRFTCSQAQHYLWMKEKQPALYERIKQAVRKGNWLPVGGSWIEPDCNLPSGESLVRQFLYGQRFFEQEFGFRCREFWNPDVFGYSGALPQIMRGAGIEFFLTQKLSWNQFNKPMHHSFTWEGIDGSQVLTHFPPGDTYNGMWDQKGFPLQDILHTSTNAKDHDRTNQSVFLFGFGDGGGGPTREMLEVLRRLHDLQGVPRVEQRAPHQFFDRLKSSLRDCPVIVGELYFELHRGTYTTQATIKRNNRQAEFLLRETELVALAALRLKKTAYPGERMENLWRLTLLNQFHDIIPGSSIAEVYRDSEKQYAELFEQAASLVQDGQRALLPLAGTSLFNPCAWERRELVTVSEPISESQLTSEGKILALAQSPGLGFSPLVCAAATQGPARAYEDPDGFVLENDFLEARFSRQGNLTSLRDKPADRLVVVLAAPGNRFMLYEDRPHAHDAWEVDPAHLETGRPAPGADRCQLLEDGPHRAGLGFEIKFGKSRLRQQIYLHATDRLLRFACQADWRERHTFLKVEFPVEVRAPEAAFEIQFGYVKRPTHFNTTYDIARFESCAHKWADLSQPDYGVALLSDCKYGYAVHGSVLRLSLLRAPTYPDEEADQGAHEFGFALYPHAGDLVAGEVVRRAFEFNQPLRTVSGTGSATGPLFATDNPNLIIDTVKRAEDSDAAIVRLYEANGTSGTATLRSALPFSRAWKVNLLEDEEAKLRWSDHAVSLSFRPFEIISLKLQ